MGIAALVLAGVGIWFLSPAGDAGHFGVWSLLPATVSIVACFMTRNIILALLLGVMTGGLVSGQLNIINAYLIPSLGTENYAQILVVYLWALGGLLGL